MIITKLNMPQTSEEVYASSIHSSVHDGAMNCKWPFVAVLEGSILKLQTFLFSPGIFYNSCMGMMLCFMSLTFTQL
jgi:hypothetical protein